MGPGPAPCPGHLARPRRSGERSALPVLDDHDRGARAALSAARRAGAAALAPPPDPAPGRPGVNGGPADSWTSQPCRPATCDFQAGGAAGLPGPRLLAQPPRPGPRNAAPAAPRSRHAQALRIISGTVDHPVCLLDVCLSSAYVSTRPLRANDGQSLGYGHPGARTLRQQSRVPPQLL